MFKEFAYVKKEHSNDKGTFLVKFNDSFIKLKAGDFVYDDKNTYIVVFSTNIDQDDSEMIDMLAAGADGRMVEPTGYAKKVMFNGEE